MDILTYREAIDLLSFRVPSMNSETDNPEIHNNALGVYGSSRKMLYKVDCGDAVI